MKTKCSNNVYYNFKELEEARYDIMERLNVFYSKKKDLEYEIDKEKKEDPSHEIFELEDKVKECDPLIGLLISPKTNETETCA